MRIFERTEVISEGSPPKITAGPELHNYLTISQPRDSRDHGHMQTGKRAVVDGRRASLSIDFGV